MVWIEVDHDQARHACLRTASRRCPRPRFPRRVAPAHPPARAARRAAAPAPRLLRPRCRPRDGRRAPSGEVACVSSVDLPMPGSPPTSSTEPRTKPPPVTRSSSAIPDGQARRLLALAGQGFQLEQPALALASGSDRHRGRAGRVLLRQRVPLAAGLALALPAVDTPRRSSGRRRRGCFSPWGEVRRISMFLFCSITY